MSSNVSASIVIPVFNQAFLTRVCLASLKLAKLEGAEIIVVDNGSSDETPQLLAEWSEEANSRRVLRSEKNLGFGRGCNWGASEAKGEVVVFLNNDTFVLADWLPNLLRPFSDSSIKVTGSRLLYPNGRVQHAGIAFNELGPHHIFVGLPGDSPLVLQERDYQVVTGASLAIRRDEFERLDGFEVSYENSFEDVDLCLRVKQGGGRVVYVPGSVAYHWESMTEGRLAPTDMRNYKLFIGRWKGKFEEDIPELLAAAQASGQDLQDRVPSRREVLDRQERIEKWGRRVEKVEAWFLHLRSKVRLRTRVRKIFSRAI